MKQTIYLIIYFIFSITLCYGIKEEKYVDHLIPAKSPFDSSWSIDESWTVLSHALLKDFPIWSPAKFYCVPSFKGAYGFSIIIDKDKIYPLEDVRPLRATKYFLVSNQLSKSFTELERKDDFETKNCRREISKKLVEEIESIWKEYLSEVSIPKPSELVPDVTDGAFYYFVTTETWGLSTGMIHEAFKEEQPKLFKLVQIANFIFEFSTNKIENEEDLIKKINNT